MENRRILPNKMTKIKFLNESTETVYLFELSLPW